MTIEERIQKRIAQLEKELAEEQAKFQQHPLIQHHLKLLEEFERNAFVVQSRANFHAYAATIGEMRRALLDTDPAQDMTGDELQELEHAVSAAVPAPGRPDSPDAPGDNHPTDMGSQCEDSGPSIGDSSASGRVSGGDGLTVTTNPAESILQHSAADVSDGATARSGADYHYSGIASAYPDPPRAVIYTHPADGERTGDRTG